MLLATKPAAAEPSVNFSHMFKAAVQTVSKAAPKATDTDDSIAAEPAPKSTTRVTEAQTHAQPRKRPSTKTATARVKTEPKEPTELQVEQGKARCNRRNANKKLKRALRKAETAPCEAAPVTELQVEQGKARCARHNAKKEAHNDAQKCRN